ncbi:MAG: MFS transporter [Chloroflexota bacterium]|nr:MFS transporter [Chloroflexota bacterium]
MSVIGNWMQKVAQAWLVLELTDSGTLLGLTAALQHLPTLLLTPYGGLLADRVDKRKILIIAQAASAVPALLLGLLTASGAVTLWMILLLALILGVIEAFEKPARHSFPIEMVGPEHLTNAIALSTIVINAGRVIGPAIAGLLITTVGLSASFLLNALSFGAVVAGLLLIRPGQLYRSPPAKRAPGQLREGLRYVRRQPALLWPLILMAVSGMLAYEWIVTLPLLARETFNGGANIAGLMFAAMGCGAIIGGLAIAAWLEASPERLVITGLLFSGILVLLSLAPTLPTAYGLLFILGAASIAFRSIATSLIQLRAGAEMRGRVMALLVVAIGGTTPVGAPLVGWIGDVMGARAPLMVGGLATAVACLVTHLLLRRHDREPADVPDTRNAERINAVPVAGQAADCTGPGRHHVHSEPAGL